MIWRTSQRFFFIQLCGGVYACVCACVYVCVGVGRGGLDQKNPLHKLHVNSHSSIIPSSCPFLPPTHTPSASSCLLLSLYLPLFALLLSLLQPKMCLSLTSKKPRLESQRQWQLESVRAWYGMPFYPTWKRRYLSRMVREGDTEGWSGEEEKGGSLGRQRTKDRKNEKVFSIINMCFFFFFFLRNLKTRMEEESSSNALNSSSATLAATHPLPSGLCSNHRDTTNQQ